MSEYWNDNMTLDDVVEVNKMLVYKLANRHQRKIAYDPANDIEDLVQEGMIGLIKAHRSFNKKANIKFSTYAGRCIENQILVYLRDRRVSKVTGISLDSTVNSKNNDDERSGKSLLESDDNVESIVSTNETRNVLEDKLLDETYKMLDICYPDEKGSYIEKKQRLVTILKLYYKEVSKKETDKILKQDLYEDNKNIFSSRSNFSRDVRDVQVYLCDVLFRIGEHELYSRYKELLSNEKDKTERVYNKIDKNIGKLVLV